MASVWGSKVWTLLHRLSFYSNRQDVGGAWKTVLRTLSETLPCQYCRNHMREYLNKNPLTFPASASGQIKRETIILWLFNFHNHVNQSLGRQPFAFDLLELEYGQGRFDEAVAHAKQIVSELDKLWVGVLSREWRMSITYLCNLINGGPL